MFLDKKLQVDLDIMGELPELAICGCEWGPFCVGLITFESTSLIVLSTPPLQAKPFIAREAGRPLEKNLCLVWLQKGIDLRNGKR
jgi:hypothetical protein